MSTKNLVSRAKGFTRTKGFTLIEVLIVVSIIGLLAAIAIPNYIHTRNKGYCSLVERDADAVAKGLAGYFGNPYHVALPDVKDVAAVANPVVISGDPNEIIYIVVKDKSNRCPDDYQRSMDGWDMTANTYTKEME